MNVEELKKFVTLWHDYFALLPMNDYEFDQYLKIINKLRNNDMKFNDAKENKNFIILIEIMAQSIYNYKKYDDKYDDEYYHQTKLYDDDELNYCSRILNYLEDYTISELENAYDEAFTNSILDQNL